MPSYVRFPLASYVKSFAPASLLTALASVSHKRPRHIGQSSVSVFPLVQMEDPPGAGDGLCWSWCSPFLAQVCFYHGHRRREMAFYAFQWRRSSPFFLTRANTTPHLRQEQSTPAPLRTRTNGLYLALLWTWSDFNVQNKRKLREESCTESDEEPRAQAPKPP